MLRTFWACYREALTLNLFSSLFCRYVLIRLSCIHSLVKNATKRRWELIQFAFSPHTIYPKQYSSAMSFDGHITEGELESYISDCVKSTSCLSSMETTFLPFYVFTACSRFLFLLDPHRRRSIPIRKLALSMNDFSAVSAFLKIEIDQTLLTPRTVVQLVLISYMFLCVLCTHLLCRPRHGRTDVSSPFFAVRS